MTWHQLVARMRNAYVSLGIPFLPLLSMTVLGLGQEDFAKAAADFRKAVYNGEVDKHPAPEIDPLPKELQKIAAPQTPPQALASVERARAPLAPVDLSKVKLGNDTAVEPLVDWAKKNKKVQEAEKVQKEQRDAAIRVFRKSYKALQEQNITGATFDKHSLVEQTEELPHLWYRPVLAGTLGFAVLGFVAFLSFLRCRRVYAVLGSQPLNHLDLDR
mmetsp:Transcript_51944/g.93509  ORF Transcript_51944/g.93509 Transcript_51944/m.93509 type:complete len:216 (+) Transcript_51944:16-663(+)